MTLKIEVEQSSQISVLLELVRVFLMQIGLNERIFVETLTLCSELINNIHSHTPKGSLSIKYSDDKIITIVASDSGSGIKNIDKALKEGYSTAGSLGIGFPSIIRLSNELFVVTSIRGTKITCIKYEK